MLHNMKDLEFQISENQDNISKLMEKTDNITKDLDDLVSLYEIVSEQMNPFVGLSKVTKKRIEALENFTKELENVKNRLENVESEISHAESSYNNMSMMDHESKIIENDEIPKTDVKKEVVRNDKNHDPSNKELNEDSIEKFMNDNYIDNIIEELIIKYY